MITLDELHSFIFVNLVCASILLIGYLINEFAYACWTVWVMLYVIAKPRHYYPIWFGPSKCLFIVLLFLVIPGAYMWWIKSNTRDTPMQPFFISILTQPFYKVTDIYENMKIFSFIDTDTTLPVTNTCCQLQLKKFWRLKLSIRGKRYWPLSGRFFFKFLTKRSDKELLCRLEVGCINPTLIRSYLISISGCWIYPDFEEE